MTILARSSAPVRIGRLLILVLLTLAVCPQPAQAQDDDPARMLEDFVHYARIARTDLASASAQELLASGVTNAELAVLVEAKGPEFLDRFDRAIGRAVLVAELEDLAGEIGQRVELGRMDLARESARIEEAIEMLIGTQRQKMLGAGRLEAAGEYAVPALLRAITDGHDEKLKLACRKMLGQIGVQSVTPLSIALADIDPRSQQTVCDVLGQIGYRHAAPYLRDLSLAPGTGGPVRDAAERAFREVQGLDEDLSLQYAGLARQYYDRQQSLVAFPFDDRNNVWSFDQHAGLVLMPVPTVVFDEIMAMKLATRALALDPTNREALSLYVAANLKRENDLPLGESDPIYGEATYTPEFFATVFGTDVCQDVLALAIDTNDTLLVRDAIAALSQTTGGSNLFGAVGGRRPLLEALSYPDRRVQYEAALTLARALPNESFDGDYRVVPILASAVRMGEQSFALVVSDDEENRRQAMIALEDNTFTIAGAESSVPALAGAIADAPGIDLVTVRMNSGAAAREVVESLRYGTKTAAAPILIVAPAVDAPSLELDYSGDPQIKIARPGIGSTAFTNALTELLERAAGGRLTEAEAEAYAFEALGALEDIAIAQSPAYTLDDAETSLLEALNARTGRARLLVANILARIDSDATQHALFDAAITASGGEQIDLLDQVAASIKRFGDRAQKRHLLNVLDLIENSSGSTAEAAARVHGSMNLATTDAVRLIVEGDG